MAPWSLVEIDSLEVKVIVDNEVDPLSPNNADPAAVETPGPMRGIPLTPLPPGEGRAGMQLRMDSICHGAHGLSLMITATRGDTQHTLLFDAGPEGDVWQRNATRLRADVGLVERIHLSHWHHDHSGGLVRAVSMILAARRERPTTAGPMETLVADLHVDRPEVRGLKAPPRAAGEEYSVVSLEPDPSFDELTAQGAVIELSNQPHSVLDDMFLISGEIPRKTAYEKGIRGALRFSPGHPGPGRWEPDELIMDERFVVCHLKNKGLVVFTGCSHAGVVNVSRHAVHLAGGSVPLYAVVGGFHLADGSPDKLQATLDDLGALKPHVLIPGHCTGWRFKFKIEQEMAAVLVPCFSGTTYTLRSEP